MSVILNLKFHSEIENVKMSLVIDIHHSKMLFLGKNYIFFSEIVRACNFKVCYETGHLDYMLALQSGEKFDNHFKIRSIFVPRNGNHYPSLFFRIVSFPMTNFRFYLLTFIIDDQLCSAMGKFSRDVLALHSSHEISAISCRCHMMSHKA